MKNGFVIIVDYCQERSHPLLRDPSSILGNADIIEVSNLLNLRYQCRLDMSSPLSLRLAMNTSFQHPLLVPGFMMLVRVAKVQPSCSCPLGETDVPCGSSFLQLQVRPIRDTATGVLTKVPWSLGPHSEFYSGLWALRWRASGLL